jgi:uncharacterized protein (DUF952 family)
MVRPPIVIDFETSLHMDDGTRVASTEAYRHDFRVDSMATTIKVDEIFSSKFFQGEDAIRIELERIAAEGLPVIAHNLQYEMLVTLCRFPHLYEKLQWYADTMRLAQNYDNGGDENSYETIILDDNLLDMEDVAEMLAAVENGVERELVSGLGLVKCLKRIFKADYQDHKNEAYSWLRDNGIKKGEEGANLHLLPEDILERYNVGDTEWTYQLYQICIDTFRRVNYDWTLDHMLFLSSVRLLVRAKTEGIDVQREALTAYIADTTKEIADIGQAFLEKYKDAIVQVEADRLYKWIYGPKSPKTERGKKKREETCVPGSKSWNKNVKFNPGSNHQLVVMFRDKLGIVPKFFSEKGSPSFKASVLDQWGEGGTMLEKRRKRLLVLKQSEALLELSSYDGKFRPEIRAAGTSTGRYVGAK